MLSSLYKSSILYMFSFTFESSITISCFWSNFKSLSFYLLWRTSKSVKKAKKFSTLILSLDSLYDSNNSSKCLSTIIFYSCVYCSLSEYLLLISPSTSMTTIRKSCSSNYPFLFSSCRSQNSRTFISSYSSLRRTILINSFWSCFWLSWISSELYSSSFSSSC